MPRKLAVAALLLAAGFVAGRAADTKPESIVEQEAALAVRQPGPHRGTGHTTAYPFFSKAPGLEMVFRKRALHKGASIGYHEQKEDEIYYVLSGEGELTLNGKTQRVGPGTAMLTRPGSSHGLKQVGEEDLVIIIAYQVQAKR
jgi:quercetin dioxygenase-like cupin family protein